MTFQSTVASTQGFGVVGEFAKDSPHRVDPYILNSADAAYNVVGRVFIVSAEGVAAAGGTVTAGTLAGILVSPKSYVSGGTSAGGTLAPTLTLRNGEVGELCTMGEIIVAVPASAAIGDAVKYNTTTGVIGTGSPSAGEAALPNAYVTQLTPAAAGLAIIKITA